MKTHYELLGTNVPRVGFGTWELRGDACYDMVRTALDLGYRHLDTAAMYGNEEVVGRAIRDAGIPREELFVVTKIWRDQLASGVLQAALRDSLGRLGLASVDLAMVHWPTDEVPVSETMEALQLAQSEGLCHHFGVCNFTPTLLRTALEAAHLAAVQVEYHPFLEQRALLRLCRENDLMLVAYSPLARGRVAQDPVLRRIAAGRGVSAGVVALAWLLKDPEVLVIPKASSREHAADNLRALDLELTREEIAAIDALRKDLRLVDPDFAPDWGTGEHRGVLGSVRAA